MKVLRVISLTVCLSGTVLLSFLVATALTDPIELSSFLPQLMSIHEACKALAESNSLLRAKILEGLRGSNKTEPVRPPAHQSSAPANSSSLVPTLYVAQNKNTTQLKTPPTNTNKTIINYEELEGFNKWVGVNLDYAINNTLATAEALKEEALENNGTVDYSLEFIEDGQRGVKYWQAAVSFQDKTLKNEKFEIDTI